MVRGWMLTATKPGTTNEETTNVRLFCGRNSDAMIRKLEDAMVNNKDVSCLEIRETALEDDVIDSIVDLLSKGSVKTIHLEACSAQHLNKSAVKLVEALGNCRDVRLSEHTFLSKFFLDDFLESAKHLKYLRIRDHLVVEQVEALSRGLASNKILHSLDLSRSRIDDFSVLAEGLKGGCAKKLKLRSIGLRDCHLATLMAALESPLSSSSSSSSLASYSSIASSPNAAATALESLDLSFNRLRNLECIGKFLRRPDCNLKELLIGYQNLWQPNHNGTNIDVSEIAIALTTNKQLTTLKLPRNELGDFDASLFAVALSENLTLETLDLRENNIRNDGVIALAEAATISKSLGQMHLRGNHFGRPASLALLEAVSKNYHLRYLWGSGRDKDEAVNSQIRYQTALNRGGRKMLLEVDRHPLGLWPLVLEKQTRLGGKKGTGEAHPQPDRRSAGMHNTDVLYYFLKASPTTFFSSRAERKGPYRGVVR